MKYTVEQLKAAVASAQSLAATLKALGLYVGGNNYTVLRRSIKANKIDTSHFLGMAIRRGKTFGPKKPLKDYLVFGSTIQTYQLKRRLIADKLLKLQCARCLKKKWLGTTIPLELDHIDGDHRNNVLDNLRLLCPNCHAQTPTHAGKNKGKVKYL